MTIPGDELARFRQQVENGFPEAVGKLAYILKAEIQKQLSTPGQGRQYGKHRASKPGDPPAPDTGTLKRSAFVEKVATGFFVGVATKYARLLEFGTSRMQPRPFMRPALAAVQQQTGIVMEQELTAERG